jgi:DMSO/TMAO reductase YedYZ molybdopterin-dependent catalytic subunit
MSSENQKGRKLPPGQRAINRLMRWGTDHPGIKSINPKISLETYTLTIDGEVKNHAKLNWKEVLELPKTVSISDFHCVEGWSVLDSRWEGVRFKDIEKLVKPLNTARAATFECADAYTTSLFREELAGDDVLLAYRLNGQELEEGYGFPLRLVVPNKYAIKAACG